MSDQPILLAISGPSSCGKTTLARLLARIFPHSSILHADDYYFPDSKIPINNGIQDWDCAGAIDVERLVSALKRIKAGETVDEVRDGIASTEIPEPEGAGSIVQNDDLELLRHDIARWEAEMNRSRQGRGRPPLVIIDGFLLYAESVRAVRDQLDIKILLRSKYEDSKRRREAREGYITQEDFWKDPPGYFDQIVWPNFVKDHSFLFEDGNVQGSVDQAVASGLRIDIVPGIGQDALVNTLRWVVELVRQRVSNVL